MGALKERAGVERVEAEVGLVESSEDGPRIDDETLDVGVRRKILGVSYRDEVRAGTRRSPCTGGCPGSTFRDGPSRRARLPHAGRPSRGRRSLPQHEVRGFTRMSPNTTGAAIRRRRPLIEVSTSEGPRRL